MSSLDLSGIGPDAIEELHRQGEVCLQGTLQLALAADQRATMMAGIFGASAAALLAVSATLLDASPVNEPFLYAVLAAAASSFVGVVFCAWAVLPANIFVPGYEPRKLVRSATDKPWILRYSGEDLQLRIDANRRALERASKLFTCGLGFGLASPAVALVAYIAVYLLSGG